jgi:hypothetical protein
VRFELLRQGFPLTGLPKIAEALQRFSESRWAGYDQAEAEKEGVGVVGGSSASSGVGGSKGAAVPAEAGGNSAGVTTAAAASGTGPISEDNLFVDVVRDVIAAMRFLAKGPLTGDPIAAAEEELLQTETEGIAQDTAAARRAVFGKKFEHTTAEEVNAMTEKQRTAYEKKVPKYQQKLEKLGQARQKKTEKEIDKRRKQK